MSDRCSACGRAVESRTRGAARILAALNVPYVECGPEEPSMAELHLAWRSVDEMHNAIVAARIAATDMLCLCEQSSAMAEVS